MPWLAQAAARVRRRGADLEPHDWSDQACRIRQEALDVDLWERRRRGRPVRLWSAQLVVRTAGLDADDARFRLACLAHPYHRIGDVPRLYATAGPTEWPVPDEYGAITDEEAAEAASLRRMYPAALAERRRRAVETGHVTGTGHAAEGATPVGGGGAGANVDGVDPDGVDPAARLHAADHAAALEMAGRGVRRTVAPGLIPSGLRCWQAWQRVLFLAGPGDARDRAEELAATVVDARGAVAASVASVQEEEGRRDPVDGRMVHPAYDVGPFGVEALWDDFDTDPRPPGDPDVLSAVLLRAAAYTRQEYGIGTARSGIHMNANLCNAPKITYPR
ncbi:hypothetical protein ACZ91_60200 [Streptomyces regensis]|nr:hypothetical protein ACZ91_60200 [Streptomyces regensis]